MKLNKANKSKYPNMSRICLTLIAVLLLMPSLSFAAENSPLTTMSNIVSRDDGYHAIYINAGLSNSDSCDMFDRIILVEESSTDRSMLAMLLTSLMSNASVILKVDGCVIVHSETTLTAPVLTKVKILAPSS